MPGRRKSKRKSSTRSFEDGDAEGEVDAILAEPRRKRKAEVEEVSVAEMAIPVAVGWQ